jgi:hypothetical protein
MFFRASLLVATVILKSRRIPLSRIVTLGIFRITKVQGASHSIERKLAPPPYLDPEFSILLLGRAVLRVACKIRF